MASGPPELLEELEDEELLELDELLLELEELELDELLELDDELGPGSPSGGVAPPQPTNNAPSKPIPASGNGVLAQKRDWIFM